MQVNLNALCVRPALKSEEPRYRELMQQHHYLGDLSKIGHTLWYVATYAGEWSALLSFSASAWKCGVRDRWIGWDFRHQFDRQQQSLSDSAGMALSQSGFQSIILVLPTDCRRLANAFWPAFALTGNLR